MGSSAILPAGERGFWRGCKQPIVISATLGTPTGRAKGAGVPQGVSHRMALRLRQNDGTHRGRRALSARQPRHTLRMALGWVLRGSGLALAWFYEMVLAWFWVGFGVAPA